jgi:hypothetical protein
MFCVLAAWGYPAGAMRGRLWALAATAGDRRKTRPRASLLNAKAHFLLDGSRTYSLRKHPVPPRATG